MRRNIFLYRLRPERTSWRLTRLPVKGEVCTLAVTSSCNFRSWKARGAPGLFHAWKTQMVKYFGRQEVAKRCGIAMEVHGISLGTRLTKVRLTDWEACASLPKVNMQRKVSRTGVIGSSQRISDWKHFCRKRNVACWIWLRECNSKWPAARRPSLPSLDIWLCSSNTRMTGAASLHEYSFRM